MVATILMQTHYLAHGLEFFDALFIVPVFQCFFIVLSIMGGALYWKEMANFNAGQWTLFPIGVLVTLYGVYLMSSRDMVIDADEENLLPDGSEKNGGGSIEDGQNNGDVSVARPRFVTEHPRLAKALIPFTLLDNPVLRSESIARRPMVAGSKRHLSRKSRMVSRTGVFMPLALDHGTLSIYFSCVSTTHIEHTHTQQKLDTLLDIEE
jgi:hypothetical protein